MADLQDTRSEEARHSFFAKQALIQTARTAFQQLAAVLRNTTLYPEDHPFLQASAEKFLASFELLKTDRKEVAFYLVGGELFFETHSVPLDPSLTLTLEFFVNREVSAIIFKPGLIETELIHFAVLVNKDTLSEQGTMAHMIAQEGIIHIELHQVSVVEKKSVESTEGKQKAAVIFQEAVDMVKQTVQAVHLEKAINMRKMNETVQTMVDNILDNRDALLGLTSIKMYDEYTFAHSVNTSILSVSLGTFLSFKKSQLAALGLAGLLHDIGKVNIPHEIINKPGNLTDAEWMFIKRHPIEGALILADVPAISKLAMIAAFEHHQHSDAKGYPAIDNQLQQHPFSQIISLADAYDALTAARVYYKVQIPPEQGIRILIKKRNNFNPTLVKAFVNMMGIFPIGTLVKLDTGETGIVVRQSKNLMRPSILLLTRFDGSEKQEGREIPLLENQGGRYTRTIIGTIDNHVAKVDVKKYLL